MKNETFLRVLPGFTTRNPPFKRPFPQFTYLVSVYIQTVPIFLARSAHITANRAKIIGHPVCHGHTSAPGLFGLSFGFYIFHFITQETTNAD